VAETFDLSVGVRLEPIAHGFVHSRLPAFTGGFQFGQYVRIEADGGRYLGGAFLRAAQSTLFIECDQIRIQIGRQHIRSWFEY